MKGIKLLAGLRGRFVWRSVQFRTHHLVLTYRILRGAGQMDAGIYASYLRCELKNRGVSLALIAEEVGVSTSLVGKTLKRQRNNKEIQEYVAAKLGVEPPQLWSLNFRGTLESIEVEEDGGDQRKAS